MKEEKVGAKYSKKEEKIKVPLTAGNARGSST